MKIILNGEEINLDQISNIFDLVKKFDLDTKKVAVERNLEVIPQSEFGETNINEGDRIEIIHFIGGG